MYVGIFSAIVGVLVLCGYVYDVVWLTQIRPGWVSMKPFTASAFVCAGVMAATMGPALRHKSLKWEVACSTAASSLMMLLFWETVRFAIDGNPIAAQYDPGLVETVLPGIPSVGTIVCFSLIAMCGMFAVWNTTRASRRIKRLSMGIVAIATVALVGGYGLDVAILRFYSEKYSTGMAFHTAALFFIVGASLIRTSQAVKNQIAAEEQQTQENEII